MKGSVSGCSLKRVHSVKTKAKGEHTNTWHTCIDTVGVVTLTHPVWYHWWELPQVSCLMQQKFSCDNTCLLSWQLLTWQNYVCCNQNIFVSTNTTLLQQAYFCHNKHMFVVTKRVIYCDKNFVVANTCLSWQKICHDKCFVAPDKYTFVATKDMFCCNTHNTNKLLSQQNWYLWQLPPMIVWCVKLFRLGICSIHRYPVHVTTLILLNRKRDHMHSKPSNHLWVTWLRQWDCLSSETAFSRSQGSCPVTHPQVQPPVCKPSPGTYHDLTLTTLTDWPLLYYKRDHKGTLKTCSHVRKKP